VAYWEGEKIVLDVFLNTISPQSEEALLSELAPMQLELQQLDVIFVISGRAGEKKKVGSEKNKNKSKSTKVTSFAATTAGYPEGAIRYGAA
jgi:hypothetical protein